VWTPSDDQLEAYHTLALWSPSWIAERCDAFDAAFRILIGQGLGKRGRTYELVQFVSGQSDGRCFLGKNTDCKSAGSRLRWFESNSAHSLCKQGEIHRRVHGAGETAQQLGHGQNLRTFISHYKNRVKPADATRFWKLMPDAGAVTPAPSRARPLRVLPDSVPSPSPSH